MKTYNTTVLNERENASWLHLEEVQLTYKNKVVASQRPKVNGAEDALSLFRSIWDAEQIELVESFKMLLLNNGNRVLGVYHASQGGAVGTIVDIRILLTVALKANAGKLLVAHNHPSGNLTPSHSDIKLTEKLKEGAKLLEIQLLDHLILTSESYYSFANDGLI